MQDTHPAAAAVQLDLLRQATPARRFALMSSMSRSAVWLARRAIARQLGTEDQQEVGLEFVRLHYGEELARRVAARLVR